MPILKRMLELGCNLIDYEIVTSKFWAILNWLGLNDDDYRPLFYYVQENQIQQLLCYSLDYYSTLLVRLYTFDGQAVPGGKPYIIIYQDAQDMNGRPYKHIIDIKEMASYQDALNYIATQEIAGKYEIVGLDPLNSPFPLEAVENYELVYSSTASMANAPPEIKIFKYTGDD